MHVHVDGVARQIEEQHERGTVARRERGAIPGLRGAQDERVADRPAAHEHVALPSRGLGLGRPLREAAQLERPFPVRHGQQGVGEPGAPQRVDAVARPHRGGKVEQGTLVAREGERDVRTGQREHRECLHDGPRLRRLGAQELAARRRIEEQRPHRDRRAVLSHGVLHRLAPAPGGTEARAARAVRRRLELEARHRRDRGQRLAAEPERPYADQVGGLADLARGVARQRQLGVRPAHPRTVVAHPDQALPAVLDLDPDRARTGVERVLDQLLDDRRRSLDHLARGDLVGDLGCEHGDPRRHRGTTSEASTQPRTPSARHTSSHAPYRRITSSAAPACSAVAGLAAP